MRLCTSRMVRYTDAMTETLTLTIPVGETWGFEAPVAVDLLDASGVVAAEVSQAVGTLFLTGIPNHTVRVPANALWWEVK